jgi:glycosyltransferase involved in cell wall biosynthesis
MSRTVSILIPCFNCSPWIGATLESALAQTWPDCEVIAVDDGSTDDTSARLEAFRSRGVTVLRQPNRGASAARNRALAEARGNFIQFLDADDLLSDDKIAVQVEALEPHADRKVASCAWGWFSTTAADATMSAETIWDDQSPIDFLVACARENLMFPPCAWLIPRRLCDAAGPWNETLSMNDDGEYMARVLAASGGIRFCEGARAYYRNANPDSYSGRRTAAAADSDLRAWDAIVAVMMRMEKSDRVAKAAAIGYQRIRIRYRGECPKVVAAAQQRERAFGGGDERLDPGLLLRITSRVLGWERAARLGRALGVK